MACFSVADKNKPEQSGLCSDEAERVGFSAKASGCLSSRLRCSGTSLPGAGGRRTAASPLPPFESLPSQQQSRTPVRCTGALLWRRGWDSPRRPRAACLPDCAAPGHRSPGRGDAALRPPLFRPSNPFLLNSKAGRPCVARAPCFGGEGGILREGLGLLVFQTALLRDIAPRGGGTPHCGLPSSALRIPSFSTAKQDARALHGRPALAERVGFEPTCRCRQTDFESAPL